MYLNLILVVMQQVPISSESPIFYLLFTCLIFYLKYLQEEDTC